MEAEPRSDEELLDEGLPLPLEEREALQFGTVRLVEVQRGGSANDIA